ncbi:MAG TPA: LysM peptidoglycan-binding domain-containing protein [Kofleriaceae bacterium]|nr:LysM peptidoglycan-binding domain-containing protein [Kofleriaceae bacterium]
MADAPDPWWYHNKPGASQPKPGDTPQLPASGARADDNKRARIEVLRPESYAGSPFYLCFNPTELQLVKGNTFQEVPIPGLDAPPIQYVRGASEKLTFEAMFDTSDEMTSVRDKYVDPIRGLLAIDSTIHAPPIVVFVWENFKFTGVIENLNVTFTLFSEKGTPVRAKLGFTIKEYTTVDQQKKIARKESPDLEKTYVVKRGDTLSAIAEVAYGDPTQWRAIAAANSIVDPRTLAIGAVITIPRLGGAA